MSEFDIIHQYFEAQIDHRSDVLVGIGDDAAVIKPPKDHELVVTTDTLIAGVHFPEFTLPHHIGHKALAVNLSDLAAMGATPAWVTLAITMPKANPEWLQAFCEGFFTLANYHQVQLIGGDTTKGALTITVQAMGFVPENQAILRSQAKPGDLIYVTGNIGDAGLALRYLQQSQPINDEDNIRYVLERLNKPQPRINVGESLRGIATAAIDISDGLAADLSHILKQSKVGATINVNQIPLSEAILHTVSLNEAIEIALTSGDDYELCFTVPEKKRSQAEKRLSSLPCLYTCIGSITADTELKLHYQDGSSYHGATLGYQHF